MPPGGSRSSLALTAETLNSILMQNNDLFPRVRLTLVAEQVAQHAAAGERTIHVQLVDAPHW